MSENLVSLLAESRRRYTDQVLFGENLDGAMCWTSYGQFEAGVATYAEQLAELAQSVAPVKATEESIERKENQHAGVKGRLDGTGDVGAGVRCARGGARDLSGR